MTVDVPAHRYTNGGRIDRSCQLGWPTWFAPKTESGGFFTRFKAESLVSIAVVIQRLQKRRMLKLSCLKVSHTLFGMIFSICDEWQVREELLGLSNRLMQQKPHNPSLKYINI